MFILYMQLFAGGGRWTETITGRRPQSRENLFLGKPSKPEKERTGLRCRIGHGNFDTH